ncbi:MAG: hypothetical protein AVDCRST_MAG55-330, partial [uncultured Rubrobacteraceae bacterium]
GEARQKPRPRGRPRHRRLRGPVLLFQLPGRGLRPRALRPGPDPRRSRPRLALLRRALFSLALLPEGAQGLRPPRDERGYLRRRALHDHLSRQARGDPEKRLCPPGLRSPHRAHRTGGRRRAGHRRNGDGTLGLYRGVRPGPAPLDDARLPRRGGLWHSRPPLEGALAARRARPPQAAPARPPRTAPTGLPRCVQRVARRPRARGRHDRLLPLLGPRVPRRLPLRRRARCERGFPADRLRLRGQLTAGRAQHDPRRHRRGRGRARPPVHEARRDALRARRGAHVRNPSRDPLVGHAYRYLGIAAGAKDTRRSAAGDRI